MRILWLKTDLLLPLDKGGKLRTWHLMRHLAKQHEITYLAFAEPDQPRADVTGMREVAARVDTVTRSEPAKGTWRFYADAAMHLVDPLPYAVGKYRSTEFRQRLDALLAEIAFDLIVCDFLFPAVNLPERLPCPAVMFTHNVESEIWRRHAETKTSPLSKLLYEMQYRRMLRYEGGALRRFDGVLAVSDADRETFDRIYPGAIRRPAHVVPTGVDTDFFAPPSGPSGVEGSEPNSRELVFTGSMDWLPNEDAMIHFCRDVLPLIRAEEPDVQLSIVGRAPTPAVEQLAEQSGIRVTGRVDDVRPYMRNAAAYIVPLRIGGGTRLKIFEAMAMGKAVVSTTVGAEGLPVTSGEHVLLADEPYAFSRAVVQLLRDVERRRQLESAARALVVEKYDWSAVAGELEEALVRFARLRADGIAAPCGSLRRVPPRAEGERRQGVGVGPHDKVNNVEADLRVGPEVTVTR
jgi:sugar transferase (PEP-CTERM/EpsH1 system associated)